MKKNKVQTVVFYTAPNQRKVFLLLKMNEQRGFFWQNITGGVEAGEDFRSAAIREAQEETGITTENIKKITPSSLEFHFIDQWKNEVTEKVFFVEATGPWEIKLDPKEHCEFSWVTQEQIKESSVHYPSNYKCLMEAINSL